MLHDMHDRMPTGDHQDTTVGCDRTDGTRLDVTVTMPEAARMLGVSTDAVRSRLRRGTLPGVKIDGEWHVTLDAHHDTRQDTDRCGFGAVDQPDRSPSPGTPAPHGNGDHVTAQGTTAGGSTQAAVGRRGHPGDRPGGARIVPSEPSAPQRPGHPPGRPPFPGASWCLRRCLAFRPPLRSPGQYVRDGHAGPFLTRGAHASP